MFIFGKLVGNTILKNAVDSPSPVRISKHLGVTNRTDHPELFRFHVLLLWKKKLCSPPSD